MKTIAERINTIVSEIESDSLQEDQEETYQNLFNDFKIDDNKTDKEESNPFLNINSQMINKQNSKNDMGLHDLLIQQEQEQKMNIKQMFKQQKSKDDPENDDFQPLIINKQNKYIHFFFFVMVKRII